MALITTSGGGVNFNSSATTQSNSIMSSIDMKPQHLLQLFKMNNLGMDSRGFLYSHMLGFSKEVAGTTYYHTEKDPSTAPLEYTSFTTASQVCVYTLKSPSTTYFYARVHDVVVDKNGVQGFVTAVDSSAGTVTVTYPAGVTAPTASTDDGILIISTRSFGENSLVGDAAFTRSSQYSNVTQIIKDKVAVTGTSFTDATWINFGPKGYYSMQLVDGELRMYRHIENMFMHGQVAGTTPVTDPTTATTGAKMVTSQGLVDVATTRGTTLSAVPSTMADWDVIGQNNLANYIKTTTPIWTNMGAASADDIDELFYGTSSALENHQSFLAKATDNSLFKASEAYGVYVNFKYLNKRYTYQFETNDAWSDQAGYGADGFGYSNKGVMVPINKVKDGMSGKMFGTMGTRYKSKNGLNRKFMVDTMNGFGSSNGGVSINEFDAKSNVWLADMGAQFMGGHQYSIW